MFKHIDFYLKDNPKGYWFKRKLYGWGWVPVRWQGWAVLGVYITLTTAFALTINKHSPWREVVFTFIMPVTFLTAALIRICYKMGERPRWSWGPEKKSESDT